LVGPTAELTQITLEFFELGVGELAMLCLACHVLEQPIGLAGDLAVLLGSRGSELLNERGGARLAETRARDKRVSRAAQPGAGCSAAAFGLSAWPIELRLAARHRRGAERHLRPALARSICQSPPARGGGLTPPAD